ncbi:cytochrome b-c1 complex subunit 6, mitochondrial-like [Amblyomma americanum]|uniref:Cytochrome b-c1 complex subunit 6 n=1 Tax=Amblyomma americanum TaxID=6943 RepID=A0A0C9SBJ2_AMBAM
MDKVKPVVKASDEEEDLVDPLDTVKEKCRAEGKCSAYGDKLQECNDRVNSRSQTLETCTEELFDFLHCVDHCAAKEIFKHLK